MKQLSGKQFAKLITRRGWNLRRINGSHHIFTVSGRREQIVIPMHGNQPLKIGLLRTLMKIAEISEKDL